MFENWNASFRMRELEGLELPNGSLLLRATVLPIDPSGLEFSDWFDSDILLFDWLSLSHACRFGFSVSNFAAHKMSAANRDLLTAPRYLTLHKTNTYIATYKPFASFFLPPGG